MKIVLKNKSHEPFVIFLALLVLLASCLFYYHHQSNSDAIWFLILGVGTSFFVWKSAEVLSSPLVVINDEGIYARSLGVGMIPWRDVQGVQIETHYNNRYICLRVRAGEKYIAKLPPKKRVKAEENSDLGFTRFNIDVKGIKTGLLEIVKIIESKSQAS